MKLKTGCEGFKVSASGFVPGVKLQLNVGVVFGTPRSVVLFCGGGSNMLLRLAGWIVGSGTFSCSSGATGDILESKEGCAEGWPELKPLNLDNVAGAGAGVADADEG